MGAYHFGPFTGSSSPQRTFRPGILIRSSPLLHVPTNINLPTSPPVSSARRRPAPPSHLPSTRASSRVLLLLSPLFCSCSLPLPKVHRSTPTWIGFVVLLRSFTGFRPGVVLEMQGLGNFRLPPFFNYPPYFTLQPVRETREKQVQLWKDLILDYCRSQKIHIISLEGDFPLFSNPKIERSLSHEAKEVFLASLVSEGRAEWMDKGHKKCLILWLRIQDWANFIFNFVKDNGLEVMTIEEIRSGIDTRGSELEGIDRDVLMRALRLLEQKGKAAIFRGTSADDEGVKFSI